MHYKYLNDAEMQKATQMTIEIYFNTKSDNTKTAITNVLIYIKQNYGTPLASCLENALNLTSKSVNP